ncbi:MAG: accessory gene regulator B family protein [Bacilli bacterium]|nr:accessory gene regulator B family protein [Bacilli bacterium]
MKKFIINGCMKYIKNNTKYDSIKLAEIRYGLEGMYLTISKLIIISILCVILGVFKEMITFLLFFNIIRMPAFGLHATKSWICLLTSTIFFIGFPILSIYLNISLIIKIIICSVCVILIYKNAPADTKKKPIVNKKRRLVYKVLSTVISIIFSIIAILIKEQFISNCLIFSLVLENLLISPLVYKLFKLPYNNYITYLKEHPDFAQ